MLDSLSLSFHQCSILHCNTAVIRRTSGRRIGSFKQSNPLLRLFRSAPTNAHRQYMFWHISLIMYMFGSPLPPSSGRVGKLFIFCQYRSRTPWWRAYRRHVADQHCMSKRLFTIKPTRCTNFANLFWLEMNLYMFRTVSLPIIRSPLTVHLGLLYVIRFEDSFQAGWNIPALFESWYTWHCYMTYTSAKCTINGLLMMGRGTARNM